jgi:hypothetical protein
MRVTRRRRGNGHARHGRGCEFLVPARPQTPLGLRVSATAHAAQPRGAALLERVQVKAYMLERPRGSAGPTGVARPNVLM